MRVIHPVEPPEPTVRLANVSPGECFYHGGDLCLLARSILNATNLVDSERYVVNLDSGKIYVMNQAVSVVPAKAHVQVEYRGRFS